MEIMDYSMLMVIEQVTNKVQAATDLRTSQKRVQVMWQFHDLPCGPNRFSPALPQSRGIDAYHAEDFLRPAGFLSGKIHELHPTKGVGPTQICFPATPEIRVPRFWTTKNLLKTKLLLGLITKLQTQVVLHYGMHLHMTNHHGNQTLANMLTH